MFGWHSHDWVTVKEEERRAVHNNTVATVYQVCRCEKRRTIYRKRVAKTWSADGYLGEGDPYKYPLDSVEYRNWCD